MKIVIWVILLKNLKNILKIPSTREAGYQVAEQKSIKQIGYELKEVYETVLS